MDKILEISISLHSFVLSLKMIDTKDVFCYFKLFLSQMVIKFQKTQKKGPSKGKNFIDLNRL